MICPTCGHKSMEPRVFRPRKKPEYRLQMEYEARQRGIDLGTLRAVGLERWEAMSELARKVILNDLRRNRCAT